MCVYLHLIAVNPDDSTMLKAKPAGKKFKRKYERKEKAPHLFSCNLNPHRNIRVGFPPKERVTLKSINNSWAANRESFINCVHTISNIDAKKVKIVKGVDNICARNGNLRVSFHNLWYVLSSFFVFVCQNSWNPSWIIWIGHEKLSHSKRIQFNRIGRSNPITVVWKMNQTFSYEFNEFITKSPINWNDYWDNVIGLSRPFTHQSWFQIQ